ncbi:MAG: transglutaminase domain-containing protein [Bacteroidota bacterium]
MKLHVLICFLFIYCGNFAQGQINESLYNRAKNTPEPNADSPEQLVEYLTKYTHDEKEKAEIISYWIAIHIAYDLPAFLSKSYQSESWDHVLSSRKAICGGYANLFKHLCAAAGIEAFVVSGYSIGSGLETTRDFKTTNHIWNVAFIENTYYQFDLTFASGFIRKNGDQYTFVKQLKPTYLFASPSGMIKTHLPAQERWQLLEKTVNLQSFTKRKKYLSGDQELFHFNDSIKAYKSLDASDRAIKDAIDAYKVNPQPRELAWIYQKQAYDISVSDSERASLEMAIDYYNAAISIYQSLKEIDLVKKCERGISYIKQQLRKGRHRD